MFNKKQKEKTEETINTKKITPRILSGVVVSEKMNKTRVVAVTRNVKHPIYAKYFALTKRYKAHDENNEYHDGDVVQIQQIRPMSRDKRWNIIGSTKRAEKKIEINENEENI